MDGKKEKRVTTELKSIRVCDRHEHKVEYPALDNCPECRNGVKPKLIDKEHK